jgi:two-component system LytT family response regulator
MIRTIIIDDEHLAIESLQWEIENFCEDLKINDTFTNPKEAIIRINYLKPDLVMLDIEMPEIDGFQLLQLLDYKNFDLIITTAYNQYAIQAFKANAIDYLLKPIDPNDLIKSIERVKKRQYNQSSNKNIETILTEFVKKNKSKHQKIPISVDSKILFVNSKDILYCKSDGSYTHLFLKNDVDYLVSKSIKHFEDILPEELFLRIHKSYIINVDEVVGINKQGNGEVILSNEAEIPISRSYKHQLLEILHVD